MEAPAPCGTPAAARRHRRRGEVCETCRGAERDSKQQDRDQAKREAAARALEAAPALPLETGTHRANLDYVIAVLIGHMRTAPTSSIAPIVAELRAALVERDRLT